MDTVVNNTLFITSRNVRIMLGEVSNGNSSVQFRFKTENKKPFKVIRSFSGFATVEHDNIYRVDFSILVGRDGRDTFNVKVFTFNKKKKNQPLHFL